MTSVIVGVVGILIIILGTVVVRKSRTGIQSQLGVLIAIIGFTALAIGAAFAHPHVDCEMVRAQVREHGKFKAIAWALANGYSPKEISRIRKQCGV